MYLKHKTSGNLVEVLDIKALLDPCQEKVAGRFHAGEELQDPENFAKTELVFPSDEVLPVCWVDAEYKLH
ncbi:MAG: acetyltransferase [Gammaproteobacteria bacterium]|jgi:hypothetical protein